MLVTQKLPIFSPFDDPPKYLLFRKENSVRVLMNYT